MSRSRRRRNSSNVSSTGTSPDQGLPLIVRDRLNVGWGFMVCNSSRVSGQTRDPPLRQTGVKTPKLLRRWKRDTMFMSQN